MPESQQPDLGTNFIINGVLKNTNRRVLDIGAGEGKWGRHLKDKVTHITGVEIWEPYISRYNLNTQYDEVIQEDARKLDFSKYDKFNVAILGDVLEHMTQKEATTFIATLKENVDEIFLSIPVTVCIQTGTNGNPFEEHLYQWTDKEIRYDLDFTLLNVGVNDNGLVCVGTYRWAK